jgi:hypothetical protein
MPYKIITTIREENQNIFHDVIDMKLSRSKKVLKLFMDKEIAANYARKELKKTDEEFKVIEVESAYDYELSVKEQQSSLSEG